MSKVIKLRQNYEMEEMAMNEVIFREDLEKNQEIKEKVEVEMGKLAEMIGRDGVQELVDMNGDNGLEVVLRVVAHMGAEYLTQFAIEDADGGKDDLEERILGICGFSIMEPPTTQAELEMKGTSLVSGLFNTHTGEIDGPAFGQKVELLRETKWKVENGTATAEDLLEAMSAMEDLDKAMEAERKFHQGQALFDLTQDFIDRVDDFMEKVMDHVDTYVEREPVETVETITQTAGHEVTK